MSTRYCPHCSQPLRGHPSAAVRCSSCRLLVGLGRTRVAPDPDIAHSGGFMANAARREQADAVKHSVAFQALRAVAADTGCRVERLRMTDYDRAVHSGTEGPSVAAILTTFDTWKLARNAARPGGASAAL